MIKLYDATKGSTKCKGCGRDLYTAESIALGYGPDCAKKRGLKVELTIEQRLRRLETGLRRLAMTRKIRAMTGTGDDRLLFPDIDSPVIKETKQQLDKLRCK